MKFFTGYFREPWKVYKAMNMDIIIWYILDQYISWPLKRQLQPSMYFMGDESSNGPWNSHEGTIKNPWKCPTHTSTISCNLKLHFMIQHQFDSLELGR